MQHASDVKSSQLHHKTFFSNDPKQIYCTSHSTDLAPCQLELIEESLKHPGSDMLGSTDVMQICSNLIQLIGAQQVLDIGTFTGHSALAWALALPDHGKVVTMDISHEAYLKYGKKIIDKSAVHHKIEFHAEPALITLNRLVDQGFNSKFDFAFIDADKQNYINYYEICIKLLKPGGIIAVDNALWCELVWMNEKDSTTKSIDALNKRAKSDDRVNTSLLPIGDGLMLIFKKRL